MTWLLKLYPPAWRRRYGRELRELIASHPASFGTAIDLIAGAIDAWMHPQGSTVMQAAPDARGEGKMLAKMMQLRCTGYGPNPTSADVWKSVGVMLGGTVALTFVWMWATRRFADNPYLDSLALMAFFIPLLVSLRFTSLKGRPARVQAVFIVGVSAILVAISLVSTWLGTRL